MRILLINDHGTAFGGAEIQFLGVLEALRRRGHDARLFSSGISTYAGSCRADYTCRGTSSRILPLLQAANPWAYWALRRTLREFQPDLVHVKTFLNQLSPLIMPLLKNFPALYQFVLYKAICPMGNKFLPNGKICQQSAGWACRQNHCLPWRGLLPSLLQIRLWRHWQGVFNLFLVPSHAMQQILRAEGIGPVEVLWNATAPRPPRPPLSQPPRVAVAGRLVREKGVDVLLQAFTNVLQQVPEAELLVFGEGPQRSELEMLRDRLGLTAHARFFGHFQHAEMDQLLNSVWVQVVPSRWMEPLANVAIEAGMRGTAVISSRIGGLPEIVQPHENGFLVPPGDSEALAQALIPLLKDINLAERIGQAARQYALKHFDMDNYMNRLEGIYERLRCLEGFDSSSGSGK